MFARNACLRRLCVSARARARARVCVCYQVDISNSQHLTAASSSRTETAMLTCHSQWLRRARPRESTWRASRLPRRTKSDHRVACSSTNRSVPQLGIAHASVLGTALICITFVFLLTPLTTAPGCGQPGRLSYSNVKYIS